MLCLFLPAKVKSAGPRASCWGTHPVPYPTPLEVVMYCSTPEGSFPRQHFAPGVCRRVCPAVTVQGTRFPGDSHAPFLPFRLSLGLLSS